MFDEVIPLDPRAFFTFTVDVHPIKKRGDFERVHRLPTLGEPAVAKVFLGWSRSGICIRVLSSKLDLAEFFLDTRDMKDVAWPTKFCHHFVITDGVCTEATRFRSEERHELADPTLISVKEERGLIVHFPQEVLYGYDPTQCDRLGFCYRLHTARAMECFSASQDDFPIEKYPALWASLQLRSE